jgi:hypothetical protein
MTFSDFSAFLKSVLPPYDEVQDGKNSLLRVVNRKSGDEVYLRYLEGLDFDVQGKDGKLKSYSFKNTNEMTALLAGIVLSRLDGIRRV